MPMTIRMAPHQGRLNTLSPVTPLILLLIPVYRVRIMLGTRERIPANRMMEMPLPMPNSVICSPSHMTKAEPAVKQSTMTMAAQTPGMDPVSSRAPELVVRMRV